jgi:hypothetical protein
MGRVRTPSIGAPGIGAPGIYAGRVLHASVSSECRVRGRTAPIPLAPDTAVVRSLHIG